MKQQQTYEGQARGAAKGTAVDIARVNQEKYQVKGSVIRPGRRNYYMYIDHTTKKNKTDIGKLDDTAL